MNRKLILLVLAMLAVNVNAQMIPNLKKSQKTAVVEINTPEYLFKGDNTMSVAVKNSGIETISSMEISYQVDENKPVVEAISDINIAPNGVYYFDFDNKWNAIAGKHSVKMWISDLNGLKNSNISDETVCTKKINVASSSVQRRCLIEEFTSSTCPPCSYVNSNIFTPEYTETIKNKTSIIKYQMNWPGAGDIYYTAEGGVRRNYYAINSVPAFRLDGNAMSSDSQAGITNSLNTAYAKESFFEITGTYKVEGTTVTVDANINPMIDANAVVHIVVTENKTVGNVGSNGETEFYDVMMKMLPNAEGTQKNFVNGTPVTIHESYDMSSTNVEDVYNTKVVVFIQNKNTKEMYQTAEMTNTTPLGLFFTPENGATEVNVINDIILQFTTDFRNLDNSEVTNEIAKSLITITDNSKADIDFTASVIGRKIVVNPTKFLPESKEITLNFQSSQLEDFSDNAFTDQVLKFNTKSIPDLTVAFTPANNTSNFGLKDTIFIDFNSTMCMKDETPLTKYMLKNFVNIYDENNKKVTIRPGMNEDCTHFILKPFGKLKTNMKYTIKFEGSKIMNHKYESPETQDIVFSTGILATKDISDNIAVYPNPASSKIIVKCKTGDNISIIDLNGNVVYETQTTAETNHINISTLQAGVYFVKIISKQNTQTKKISIIK